MIVADYIVQYLAEKGTNCAFGYPGGMVTYLMDAFDRHQHFTAYSLYHEQAAAFAACGYAQTSGHLGVAYATSGPGATNLITGICHAYFESVPTLFITGQVNTNEAKGSLNIRQKGFQETNIVDMVKQVTKYSAYIDRGEDIKYHLDQAFYYATSGRPGPVLLDIPIDIQRFELNIETLRNFTPPTETAIDYPEIVKIIKDNLKQAKKPVIILGNGIRTAGVDEQLRVVINKLNIPVVTSMIAIDAVSADYPQYYGFIGAYGHRYANLIISQSDLLISLGSRLDVRQTGANVKEFARNAKLIRIDIDSVEFENKIKPDEIDLQADLKELVYHLNSDAFSNDLIIPEKWLDQCQYYRKMLLNIDNMRPNQIVDLICEMIPDGSIITTDVGQNQVWVAQSFKVKPNQRVLFSGGHGSMGYSLPASIGAYYASQKPVYCFTGDGGLQMNIQELQFLVREKIPVKIIILNNKSLGMIRHFQEMYFHSNFTQTVAHQGYSVPDFSRVGAAYGLPSRVISEQGDLKSCQNDLTSESPALIDIMIGETTYVYPKLAFNKPIYDQEPPLDRQLLDEILAYEA